MPSRRREERGMRGMGGPGRVQRCKTHLDTALAGVRTVDFFFLCYLFSILYCCLWGQKACKYWSRTNGESIFKMSGHCLEKWNSWKVHLPRGIVSVVVNTATFGAFCPFASVCNWCVFCIQSVEKGKKKNRKLISPVCDINWEIRHSDRLVHPN